MAKRAQIQPGLDTAQRGSTLSIPASARSRNVSNLQLAVAGLLVAQSVHRRVVSTRNRLSYC
jgi:hypothetical protein